MSAPGRPGVREVAKAGDRKMLVRKTQEFRSIAAPGAAVAYRVKTAIVLNEETLGIIQYLAGTQFAAFLDLRQKFFAAHARAVKVFVPLEQVLDGGMDRAIARLLEVGNVKRISGFIFVLVVGQGAVGNECGVTIAVLSVSHFQRREDIFGCEFAQCFAAGALHNHREKEKSGIAVQPVAARSEVESFLARNGRESVGVGSH